MAQAEKAVIERPYQLPQHLYALWYDVGQLLGWQSQAVVFVALTDPHFEVYEKALPNGAKSIVQRLAKKRGVMLQFF